MTIKVFTKAMKREVHLTLGQFPAGEPLVQVQNNEVFKTGIIDILVQGHSPLQFMQLCHLLDLFTAEGVQIDLHMPYFPGGRQDRRDETALSVGVYANFINQFNVHRVNIVDPHSDVTTALINNVRVTSMADVFSQWQESVAPIKEPHKSAGLGAFDILKGKRQEVLREQMPFDGVIAPDAGASKKVFKVAQALGVPFAQAEKHRDPRTGQISGTGAPKVEDGHWLVCDDIADGGASFVYLADEFAKVNPGSTLSLYVSHGIFSKGLKELNKRYDQIITTNSFVMPNPVSQVIEVIPV